MRWQGLRRCLLDLTSKSLRVLVKADMAEIPRLQASAFRLVPAALVFIANLAAAYVVIAPLDFYFPEYGLDPSWRAVLGEASAHGWRFGRDIIFTGGPLSSIYTRWFRADLLGNYLAATGALIVGFSLLVTTLASRNGRIVIGFMVAAGTALCFLTGRSAIFVAYPLLVGLVVVSPDWGVWARTSAALGVFCSALVTLAKFLIAPAAIVTFVLCDIAAIARARWPVYTSGYLLCCFGLFAWLEGPSWFLQYIFGSIAMASGYSEAMSLDGPRGELVAFVVAAAALLLTLGWAEMRTWSKGGVISTAALLRWLILAAYLFIMFKEGFVRHDRHSLQGWSSLALAALLYPLSFRDTRMVSTLLCSVIAGVAIVAVSIADSGSLSMFQGIPAHIGRQVSLAWKFISDRERQVAQWQHAKEKAWSRVRAAHQLPRIEGSVDAIPSIQSSLLAYELDYRPRYAFQEYQAFTGELIAANRRSLLDHGPEFLLFQPGSIDSRFPGLTEGPLWPDILAAYTPVSEDGKLLLLRRRSSPLGNLLGPEASQTISFGRAVAVPDGPQFVRAKIEKTLLGKLSEVLFRPPIVWMTVGYADGTLRRFRVIPAIAEAGFVISPFVQSAREFLLLAEGRTSLLSPIKGISFESTRFYAADVRVSFSPISVEAAARGSTRSRAR